MWFGDSERASGLNAFDSPQAISESLRAAMYLDAQLLHLISELLEQFGIREPRCITGFPHFRPD
jgi:hypothetical protein